MPFELNFAQVSEPWMAAQTLVLEVAVVRRAESPKSQQRLRVLDAYRGQGHRNANLWLGYSVKTDRDWIVTNDRQYVHWIAILEADPTVKSFNLRPAVDDSASSFPERNPDIEVHRTDGTTEVHRVVLASNSNIDLAKADGTFSDRKIIVFQDADLKPKVRFAVRWAKVLGYAAVIRGQKHAPVHVALLAALTQRRAGRISEILDDLLGFDPPVVIGVLARLAIAGQVSLDLSSSGFCHSTTWQWNEREPDVVA